MLSIVMNTYQLWGVQFFVRQHAFTTADAGLRVGLVIALCGTLGVLAGGWLHDRLRARGRRDAALAVGGIAALAMLPFTLTSTLAGDPRVATLLMLPIGFFTTFGFGASGAALVLVTPPELRATASAVYLFVLNAIAMGMGPMLTAWLNDGFFHDDRAVGSSVAIVASGAVLCAAALFRWGRPHFLALPDGAAGAVAR
jgi:MFS family permease